MRPESSDPLPYMQVDRAVKPKAALLAGHLKVTTQHAVGSLVEFWDLCAGDQRDLEAVISATPPGEEPAVILEHDDVTLRFELASGHRVSPTVLTRLGLLEPVDGRFRVRGMSRYFAPIREKMVRRAAAAAAGRASASVRSTLSNRSTDVQRQTNETAIPLPPRSPPVERPATKKTAVSSQQSAVILEEEAPSPPPVLQVDLVAPDDGRREAWSKEEFWRWAESKRREVGLPPEKWPNPHKLRSWWTEARQFDVEALCEAYLSFGDAPHWQKATPPLPFAGFMSQWSDFLPRRAS